MVNYYPPNTALNTIWELEKSSIDIKEAIANKNHQKYIEASVFHLMTRALAEQLPLLEAKEITSMYRDRYKELTKDNPWRIAA
jgi:hypothetical protein